MSNYEDLRNYGPRMWKVPEEAWFIPGFNEVTGEVFINPEHICSIYVIDNLVTVNLSNGKGVQFRYDS